MIYALLHQWMFASGIVVDPNLGKILVDDENNGMLLSKLIHQIKEYLIINLKNLMWMNEVYNVDVSQSQLGGLVNGNPNITRGQEVHLLLNQVTGTNRSVIEGYMEALSQKQMDMIFSNPNGIFINGGGFINFNQVTLTTGNPVFDSFGHLLGLEVQTGNIYIGNKGLDLRAVNYLAMTQVNGKITGSDTSIDVISGVYDYDLGTVEEHYPYNEKIVILNKKPQRADESNIVMPRIDYIETHLSNASKNAGKINIFLLKRR